MLVTDFETYFSPKIFVQLSCSLKHTFAVFLWHLVQILLEHNFLCGVTVYNLQLCVTRVQLHVCGSWEASAFGTFSYKFFLPTSHFADFFMLTLGRGRVFYSFFHWPFFCASFFVSRPRLRLILTSRACFLSDSSLGSCERESGHRLVPVLYVPHKQESPQSSRCDASVPTALPPSWVCAVLWSVDALVLADWTTVSCVFV